MRTRIMTMLAALLLISTGAFAQSSETPLKGDVNEDGKVDVADINAIIKIMKDAGGTAEATTYYWYVGTDPITTSSTPGSGTVSAMTASTTLGWHNITGTPTQIQVGSTPRQSSNVTWYIAIPDNLGITKATSGGLTDGTVTSTTMTLSDGIIYRVFTTSQAKKINYLMTK